MVTVERMNGEKETIEGEHILKAAKDLVESAKKEKGILYAKLQEGDVKRIYINGKLEYEKN